MQNFKLTTLFFILFSVYRLHAHAQSKKTTPQLVKTNGITQLYTGGKPFLILGGELGNSSASDIDYMRPVWPKLK